MATTPRQLLTAADVARCCRVDIKTIHNWAARGELTHFRTPGRHLRFQRADVLDFLRRYGYPVPDWLVSGPPSVALYGPVSGDLAEGVGVIQGIYPDILTTNSYVRATFTNPDDLSVPYDVGFGIRHVEGNNQLRLIVNTNDEWMIGIGDQAAYQSGKAHGMQSEPGEQNVIELVANGDTGYLAINGTVVAVLDLSPSNAVGDVWVAAGLNQADIVSGRTSTVTDFEIWALP